MTDTSIFPDKTKRPTCHDLIEKLGPTHHFWLQIQDFVYYKYPNGLAEWNYPGKKYGWSYRIKDKRRAIIYFSPRENYFKIAFVLGQKAYDNIMNSEISMSIKDELKQAKKYAEGRGIRIDVLDNSNIAEIKKLVEIKLEK